LPDIRRIVRPCPIQEGVDDFFLPAGDGSGAGFGLVVSGCASLPTAGGGVVMRGSTTAGGAFCIVSLSPVPGGTTMAPDAAGSRGVAGPGCATASAGMPSKVIAATNVFAFMLFS
jgi:hypothetical protein